MERWELGRGPVGEGVESGGDGVSLVAFLFLTTEKKERAGSLGSEGDGQGGQGW